MKRSAPLRRKTPLKSGGFRRKPSQFEGLADRKTALRRSEIRRRVKRPTVAEGSRYLTACRGERCYLIVAGVCIGQRGTVVPCHSNQAKHGKGLGLKARHEFTVPGCNRCHEWIDRGPAPRAEKFAVWDAGFERWAPVRARKMGVSDGSDDADD
ncbi:nuclease domain-containing protein [Paraburkholderia sacchari]|uniref:nuclease domain-containing protein n=1 Tax=Paraburkholderia sacchari TaxID=159450 RepID=UPI001BCED0EF|nr:nuclease domain-containing protein [Paraburkholderia sacchari]